MSFGGWSISKTCFDYIREILPDGGTILELGSGYGTEQMSKYYNIYSIENYSGWVDKYNSTYIYAPIREYSPKTWFDGAPFDSPEGFSHKEKGWYDPEIVKNNLPKDYDLILVDDPNGRFGRGGFYKFLNWFKTDVPIIMDDIIRKPEEELMILVSKKLSRNYKILSDKVTGVIL